MKSPIDDTLRQMLQAKLEALEQYLHADVFVYYGSLAPVSANMFAKLVEDLKADAVKNDKLYVILTTLGGSAEIVERYVNILRYHNYEIKLIEKESDNSERITWYIFVSFLGRNTWLKDRVPSSSFASYLL